MNELGGIVAWLCGGAEDESDPQIRGARCPCLMRSVELVGNCVLMGVPSVCLGYCRAVPAAPILCEEQPVLGCAGVADFAELCRNLPSYLAEIL